MLAIIYQLIIGALFGIASYPAYFQFALWQARIHPRRFRGVQPAQIAATFALRTGITVAITTVLVQNVILHR